MQNNQDDKKSKATELVELGIQIMLWIGAIFLVVWFASDVWDNRYHHLATVKTEIQTIEQKIDSVQVEENSNGRQ